MTTSKKVFLMAYSRLNLGDDLFINLLLERYPNIQFYITVPNYNYIKKLDEKYNNLNVFIGEDTDTELNKLDEKTYDGYIYVGGSIFMEGGKVYNLSEEFYDFVKRCKKSNIPFCYVSSNYGPYQTEEYLNLSHKNFEDCTDICFRDLYSYNIFKEHKNTVRYAPDFIFDLQFPKQEKIKNSIGISVIARDDEFNNRYYNCLKNNIENYLNNGNSVYLYSFCKHEGDEILIDKLMDYFNNNNNIHAIKYDGNISKFLTLFYKMEYMLTARFHAMILALNAEQKISVISYSNKIDNVINDLDLKLPILKTSNIQPDTKISLNDFVNIETEKLKNIQEQAKGQETAIKKFLQEKER